MDSLWLKDEVSVKKYDFPLKNELSENNSYGVDDIASLDQPISKEYVDSRELPELTKDTKAEMEKKGYPNDIVDNINSEPEARIYLNANVEPNEINGKSVLIRTDLDLTYTDSFGDTNLERMEKGKSPLDENGKPYELHHIGQKNDSPLVELKQEEHRGKGNDAILHDKVKESEIDRGSFGSERENHWKARAEIINASAL